MWAKRKNVLIASNSKINKRMTIKTLVAALGYPIFDHIKKPQKEDILICKGKEVMVEGEYTEDGFIVFSGSICNLEETKSAGLGGEKYPKVK